MGIFFDWIGSRKDAITTLLALFFVIVGFYQYLEYRSDKKIETALSILERRESTIFVSARTYLLSKWFNAKGELREEFRNNDIYTDDLYKIITNEIHEDEKYREAILHISAFYTNAAACVLDGLCDEPVICATLMGEIQDYLDVNRNYFAYVRSLRDEDAVSLYLHHAEFVEVCDGSLFLNLYSRTDRSMSCLFARKLRRFTGLKFEDMCTGTETEYGQSIVDISQGI